MEFIRTWKKEGGWAEFEPATIDEIAQWLSDGYEVYLDEELTKSARDLDFGWLTLSDEYIEAIEDDDVLFMPRMSCIVATEEETGDVYATPIHLSAEGRAFVMQWYDDASLGYDLCNGRCKGLAGRYSEQEMWDEVESNSDYHV